MDSAAGLQDTRATNRLVEALSTVAALLDRTMHEVKTLDAEFEHRLAQALQENESACGTKAARELESALNETRLRLEDEFAKTIGNLSSQWDEERSRLNVEIGKLAQAAAQWEGEKARLNGELERLARVQAATQAEAQKALTALKAASAVKNSGLVVDGGTLTAEVQRVEHQIKAISALIEDPNTELSAIIRKNVERAELESYLRGIRFTLNSVDHR
jgi:chromosome segregation ATPase